EHLCHHHDSDV
ncbi:beta-eliminating lyase family protein, partial [Vibrio parahaemolyticus V-223/04]